MAVGDNVLAHSSVSSGSSLTIRPGSGAEWIINNLYFGDAWELYRTNGTNTVLIESGSASGALMQRKIKATYSIYFTIKNVSSTSAYFGYDGIIWK